MKSVTLFHFKSFAKSHGLYIFRETILTLYKSYTPGENFKGVYTRQGLDITDTVTFDT